MLNRLMLMTVLVCACTPTMRTKSIDDFPVYDVLTTYYKTVFAKDSAVFDATLLKTIDAETSMALKNKDIPANKVDEIMRLQHKLRSLIHYGEMVETLPSRQVDGKEVTNVGLRNDFTSLILERIRNYPAQEIVPTEQNLTEKRSIASITPQETQDLYKQIHTAAEVFVRKAMVRLAYHYPFVKTDYHKLCQTHKGGKHCDELSAGLDFEFTGEKFKDLDAVTTLINASINKLNRVATGLAKVTHRYVLDSEGKVVLNPNLKKGLVVTRLNEKSLEVQQYMYVYQLILLRLADRGVTPIFFTKTFAKQAGAVYLNETADMLGVGEFSYRQISQVTPTTVRDSLTEIQEKLIKHWLDVKHTLADFEQQKLKLSEKKIFQAILSNDVIVGGLIAKEPKHSITVLYLINKFQNQRENPKLFTSLYDIISTMEMFAMVGMFTTMWSGIALSVFIIPLVAANFVWAGLHSAQAVFDHNRYLAMERAVLANTTASMSEVMESLRAAKRTRVHAILMGTIGLSLSFPSMSYVLKHIYDGKKTFMVDMAASIFTMDDPTGVVDASALEQLNRY